MYVCVCRAVSERRIRQAAAEGCTALSELQARLGVGTVCGKCVPAARSVLTQSADSMPPQNHCGMARCA